MKKMISVLTACVIAATAVCIGTGLSAVADDAVHEHDYAEVETVDPTCEEAGYTTYQCTGCKATVTESISATGHDWMYTEYTDDLHIKGCSYCHASDIEEHNFTYESLGDETHKVTCSACTYEETEACSATDGSICDYCGGTISTGEVEEPTTEPSTDTEEPDETTTTTPSEPDEEETEVTEPSTNVEEESTAGSAADETTTETPEPTTGAAAGDATVSADESTTLSNDEETTTETTADASENTSSEDADASTAAVVTETDIPDTGADAQSSALVSVLGALGVIALAAVMIIVKVKRKGNA